MMRIRNFLGGFLSTLVIVISVLLIAVSVLPRLLGFVSCAVRDDSMAPDYPYGALVLAKRVEWEQISVGDVLIFQDPVTNACFTRMAVEKLDGQQLVTAPSMQAVADPMTTAYRCVIGRAARCIPLIGFPSVWIHTFWGKAVLALLYIIWIAVEIERRSASKRRETPT